MAPKEKSQWHQWLERMYIRRMHKYKILADYNLYRHDEAVIMYQKKREYRDQNPDERGFFIAPEGADKYLEGYNFNWEKYMEYKHKLEAINAYYSEG